MFSEWLYRDQRKTERPTGKCNGNARELGYCCRRAEQSLFTCQHWKMQRCFSIFRYIWKFFKFFNAYFLNYFTVLVCFLENL